MWNLLSWMYGKASRVYNVLLYYYNRIINSARYALSWAKSEAKKVYNSAVYYARNIVNSLEYVLRGLIDIFFTLTYNVAKSALGAALSAIQSVETWYNANIRPQINDLKARFSRLESSITATVEQWRKSLLNTITALISKVFADVIRFILVDSPLNGVLTFFSAATLQKLNDFINRMYYFLNNLIDNPTGYIMASVESVFLQFFEFAMAYALGTAEATLPPKPIWDNMKVKYPDPGKTPSGSGSLGAPVSPLWISGYTYSTPTGHKGIDLALVVGQTVKASHDGIVQEAGWSNVGYGFTVTLNSGTYWTRYAHLSRVDVHVNQRITKGQKVGLGGSTGNSTGPHLHFEVKVNGSYRDPRPLLGM